MIAVTVALMALTLAGALLAVGVKSILHAVFGLAISLAGVAGLFVLLHSPLLAVMEVLIYVGGISVAMIFAVMMSRVISVSKHEPVRRRLLAAGAALVFFGGMAVVIARTDFGAFPAPTTSRDTSAAAIGLYLLNQYNVVFETLSLVLLLAIIGAIVIARRPEQGVSTAASLPLSASVNAPASVSLSAPADEPSAPSSSRPEDSDEASPVADDSSSDRAVPLTKENAP